MTQIVITNNYIEVSEHSGYGSLGTDIVCAAISVATQFLIELEELPHEDDYAYYKIDTTNANTKAIETFESMMNDLQAQYPDNVKVSRW